MRIIAGKFGGRRIVAPRGQRTRPTTDRVREAWFSMLGPLSGRVLDLYAGTGALGFEALSRGAEHATFVENWKDAAVALRRNAETLGVTECTQLLNVAVEKCRRAVSAGAPYDLILTDPPWTAIDDAERALAALVRSDLLTDTGRVVVGHPKGRPLTLASDCGLIARDERNWGDSSATFYVRAPAHGRV